MSLRDNSLEEHYREYKKTAPKDALHKEPTVLEWKYWRLVHNRFPYTKTTKAHMMVVLKRDCLIYEISAEELAELWTTILPWADKVYHASIINLAAARTIKSTPHIHLINYLPEYL